MCLSSHPNDLLYLKNYETPSELSPLLPFCIFQVHTIVVECSHTDNLVRSTSNVVVCSSFVLPGIFMVSGSFTFHRLDLFVLPTKNTTVIQEVTWQFTIYFSNREHMGVMKARLRSHHTSTHSKLEAKLYNCWAKFKPQTLQHLFDNVLKCLRGAEKTRKCIKN